MNPASTPTSPTSAQLTNGSGAAAILAAGIGSFALAVLALAADKLPAVKTALVFYKPTGPLSGVTTVAIFIWILAWFALDLAWRRKTVALSRTGIIAFVLLVLGFLLTFPPIADVF